MGLSLLNSLPNPQQQIESLQRELYQRNRELADIQEELRQERAKTAQSSAGTKELRAVLDPLYRALQLIYGEMEAMGVPAASSGGSDPRVAKAWEAWKQKLGGQAAKAIDALLLHGSMNQVQLRIQIGCASGSTPGIVSQLWKAGLINKNGGKISLKEL